MLGWWRASVRVRGHSTQGGVRVDAEGVVDRGERESQRDEDGDCDDPPVGEAGLADGLHVDGGGDGVGVAGDRVGHAALRSVGDETQPGRNVATGPDAVVVTGRGEVPRPASARQDVTGVIKPTNPCCSSSGPAENHSDPTPPVLAVPGSRAHSPSITIGMLFASRRRPLK